MTQHTQPVAYTSQPEQNTTTSISSSNNNNASNNNTPTTSTASNSTTSNNQMQTVQQPHSNNNNNSNIANNNNSYQSQQQQQNASGGQLFNQQLQPASVYVPTHGMPAHHPQHHHQPGTMYQTMIPAAIPSNVYVNNVTANVNLHGWAHTVPHGAWVHPSGSPHYLHGDMPQEQGGPVIQSINAMPVTLPTPNALNGSVMTPNAIAITRGSRRGRGRAATSSSRRGDYNTQHHPLQEGNSAAQQSGQINQQEMQHQQQAQQQNDSHQIMTTISPSYLPHPQYAAHAPQYSYGYPTIFAPQQHVIHTGQGTAAQQPTGTPIYFSTMPVYNGPHMYNYGYYLPPVINQSEYQYGEEVAVGDEQQTAGEGAMMWPQQPIYSDEYSMSPTDMHPVGSDDLHHNASSIGSANETPSMLSPNYPPLYEQMTQQMGVMQIYEDNQMDQMQIIHPQTVLPRMEEELSECDSQLSESMQMVPPIQMLPAVAPPPLNLPAVTAEQNIHQCTTHLVQVQSGVINPFNDTLAPTTASHLQIQQRRDNLLDSNLEAETECQQEPQHHHQIQTNNILLESVQQDFYNNNKILTPGTQVLQDSDTKTYDSTFTPNSNVALETTTDVESITKQQPVYHQQQSRGKLKQQQLVPKPTASQQHQQHQHQELQTQPIPQHEQQQAVSTTQQKPQQQAHYQSSTQQQHQINPQNYDNRKSSQAINQQHQSRSRKYESHHGHGSPSSSNVNFSDQQQQQQGQQATTKTMSWTNSAQHKKSTNTVAVSAVPTASHTNRGCSNQSHNTNASNSHTHGSRSYANQQHHNYQKQQNFHYQQQPHQPLTRNYGAMKMPSSPISSAPTNVERNNSQSDGKEQTEQYISTATGAPHQFQQEQSQQTSSSDTVQAQLSSAGTSDAVATTTATAVTLKQQSQNCVSGFGTKKHSFSNQGRSGAGTTSTSSAVETPCTPSINLAPPVTSTTPAAPSTPSWASLFASNSNSSSSVISNVTSTTNNTSSTPSSSAITTTNSNKPVAKVAPYEGLRPVRPSSPVVTPGVLSYSAASTQNLSPAVSSVSMTASASKKNEPQSHGNSLADLDEYSLKFAEFLIKYKSDWSAISLRPRGLTNRSNYCYINSILQALLGCSPLYNLIRSIPKQAANFCEVKTPTVNAMIKFMSNFSNFPTGLRLRNMKGGKGNKDDMGGDLQCDSAFEPTEIYKLWNASREEHVEGRQEDAEEFLSYILNKLNDEILEVIKLIAKPNIERNGQKETQEDGDVWQMICNNRNKGSVTRQTDFGCTPLSDIFRGELRSRLQREGEHSTDVIQPFFTLQLNIEKAVSVKEALEILVGRDQLEGVTGSKSKQEVVAWQQMNLEKLPPILILHLKWFDYRSNGCTKILKKVEFPVELKIDAKILASKKYSQKQRAYRLFAVVYHDGKEATKGHYITDVYHTGYGNWLRYDDSAVKPVSENHVLLPRAPRVPYLLYYRRCDTMPQQSNNKRNNSPTDNNNSSANTESSSGKQT